MLGYLIDTFAAVRVRGDPVLRKTWHESSTAGVVALCDVVESELLLSAQSLADRLRTNELFGELFGWAVTPENLWARTGCGDCRPNTGGTAARGSRIRRSLRYLVDSTSRSHRLMVRVPVESAERGADDV